MSLSNVAIWHLKNYVRMKEMILSSIFYIWKKRFVGHMKCKFLHNSSPKSKLL